MRRWWWLVAVGVVTAVGWLAWQFRAPMLGWVQTVCGQVLPSPPAAPQPDAVKYRTLVAALDSQRRDLAKRYQAAKTPATRAAIEGEARAALEQTLPGMMRCWLGTPWDFNGTATTPGVGKIACGYFVATLLRDAGFRVNRNLLAQQASGNIMHSFLPKDACTLRVGADYTVFADDLAKAESGIYLVGLDRHVAFLVVEKDGFRFIHSSGARPWCVVDEGRDEAGALQRSHWRMLGNLTAHRAVLRRWLDHGQITVKTS